MNAMTFHMGVLRKRKCAGCGELGRLKRQVGRDERVLEGRKGVRRARTTPFLADRERAALDRAIAFSPVLVSLTSFSYRTEPSLTFSPVSRPFRDDRNVPVVPAGVSHPPRNRPPPEALAVRSGLRLVTLSFLQRDFMSTRLHDCR